MGELQRTRASATTCSVSGACCCVIATVNVLRVSCCASARTWQTDNIVGDIRRSLPYARRNAERDEASHLRHVKLRASHHERKRAQRDEHGAHPRHGDTSSARRTLTTQCPFAEARVAHGKRVTVHNIGAKVDALRSTEHTEVAASQRQWQGAAGRSGGRQSSATGVNVTRAVAPPPQAQKCLHACCHLSLWILALPRLVRPLLCPRRKRRSLRSGLAVRCC